MIALFCESKKLKIGTENAKKERDFEWVHNNRQEQLKTLIGEFVQIAEKWMVNLRALRENLRAYLFAANHVAHSTRIY